MERKKQVNIALWYLTAFGNENILWQHVEALGNDVLEFKENRKKDFSDAPHFAAWIRLCCEYFSNSLFHNYFRMYQDNKVYDYGFDKIIKLIKEEHEKKPALLKKKNLILSHVIELVYQLIDLRHCFQHGGLPNVARKLKYTAPDKIDELLNPQNFEKTKELFQKALSFTLTLPKKPAGM